MEVPPPALNVFDACSLLNLIASRRFTDIARGTPARFVTSELAADEVRYVRRDGGSADASSRRSSPISRRSAPYRVL